MPEPHCLVIAGSVRPRGISAIMAEWVATVAREAVDASFEVIDLREWPLPMDDEPDIPAYGSYQMPHTLAWSRKVAAAQGFIFVTPQYNWGYPAALKNAIDHLYVEWRGKSAAIVTFGGHGGGKCAVQLRQVLGGIKMKVAETMPALTLPEGHIEANAGTIDPAAAFATEEPIVKDAIREFHALLAEATTPTT